MKKNLVLFALLIALIITTYFLQEKRAEREYVQSRIQGKILQEEISSLKLPAVEAVKKQGQWWSGDQLLSQNYLGLMEKKLLEITSIKDIEGDPATFFTDAISFEVNNVAWKLGAMSLDKQSFYVSKGDKISLAIMDGESTTVSMSDSEIEVGKLNDFKALLLKDLPQLTERQIFRFYPKLPLERVQVNAEGNPPFELLLKENQTLPPSIAGVDFHKDIRGKFFSTITSITIKEEIPFSDKLKYKKLASMTFSAEGSTSVSWEIWLKDKNSADSILIDDRAKKAFLVVGGTLKPFFIQVQDYWDKKVIPHSSFKQFTRLPVSFIQEDKQAIVTVIDREPFDFEVKDFKVKPGNMQDLFKLLFNLDRLDQASRVSQLSKSERQHYLGQNNLKIVLMGEELLCFRKNDEMIVVNLTRGFKAHFMLPFEKLHCRFEDVLK
jgi:hypothetical protein